MLSTIVSHTRPDTSMQSFSQWLDHFSLNDKTTAADLEECRATIGSQYAIMVLWLARNEKLRPKVLTDAAYDAWVKTENPKTVMTPGEWAELFRLGSI